MWPLTVSTRPMPQSGGVRHSLPVGQSVRSAVGQPLAHVVQQEVRVGKDNLLTQGAYRVRSPGNVARSVTNGASGLREELRAFAHLRVLHVAHRRHCERLHVEHDLPEAFVRQLGPAAVGGVLTSALRRRAVLVAGRAWR